MPLTFLLNQVISKAKHAIQSAVAAVELLEVVKIIDFSLPYHTNVMKATGTGPFLPIAVA